MLTIEPDAQSPAHRPPAHRSPAHRPDDPDTIALNALGWVLSDDERAQRLMSLTGLDAETLRDGLTDPAVLGAVLEFLVNHEPDLVLAADALGRKPEELVEAHRKLAR